MKRSDFSAPLLSLLWILRYSSTFVPNINTTFMETTLNYAFAHNVLRDIVLDDINAFFKIFEQGPDTFSKFLIDVWSDVKDNNPELVSSGEEVPSFDLNFEMLDDAQGLLTIIMPPPSEVSEAYCVAIVLSETARFFTLEHGLNILTDTETYIVGEWNAEKNHLNYGELSDLSLSDFVDKIRELVA